ncbi:uncharacterized protein LOC133546548 isoform X4 [Nerophis ophidion]|uniref:uncharacterized protein LOC133546548 isoform X4 n=1 Tax=Nerophis ophidion TaxID=159077 RepID=UPI002ADFE250|nr:uncharacterized protein LOC133546548 isoform X4 [Nerophis ophidion]
MKTNHLSPHSFITVQTSSRCQQRVMKRFPPSSRSGAPVWDKRSYRPPPTLKRKRRNCRSSFKDVQQPPHIKEEGEDPQPPHMKEEEEDPQPPHIKEEEEEVWISQEGECPVGQEEADVSKFPLTVVSVKTEEHEDKPPESSQLHHSPRQQVTPEILERVRAGPARVSEVPSSSAAAPRCSPT